MIFLFFFFFFQAEDGIRDTSVTGVQTCALPIYGVQRLKPARSAWRGRAPYPEIAYHLVVLRGDDLDGGPGQQDSQRVVARQEIRRDAHIVSGHGNPRARPAPLGQQRPRAVRAVAECGIDEAARANSVAGEDLVPGWFQVGGGEKLGAVPRPVKELPLVDVTGPPGIRGEPRGRQSQLDGRAAGRGKLAARSPLDGRGGAVLVPCPLAEAVQGQRLSAVPVLVADPV